MSSLKDVARLAGVSIGTVSRFLNDPERVRITTRDAIQGAVKSLNYSPNTLARSLRSGRTNLVMAIVWAVGDPFYGDAIRGITQAAARRKFSVYIKEAHSIHMTPADLNDIVLSRQADGVILLGGPSPFELADGFEVAPSILRWSSRGRWRSRRCERSRPCTSTTSAPPATSRGSLSAKDISASLS